VRQRTDPGLLQIDEKNNMFRMRVFPVEANKEKRVWITTVRMIDQEVADLGLEHLGAAKKVSASVRVYAEEEPDLKSSEGWKFVKKGDFWEASMGGESRAIPACSIGVIQNLETQTFSYRDPETGRHYYAAAEPMKAVVKQQYDGVTQLWWDGTTEASFEVLTAVSNWMKWKQSGEIELTVFRDKLTRVGKFTIKEGECDELIQAVQEIKPHGMARPSLLDWAGDHAGVVMVSDGIYAEGFLGVPENLDFPFFPLLTAENNGNYLQSLALYKRSSILTGRLEDRSAAVYQSHNLQTGFSSEKLEFSAVEHKVAYWLWAMNTAKLFEARGSTRNVLSKFHTKHSVADGDFSWIVLESVSQHIRYDIPPAETEVELYAAWKIEKDKLEGEAPNQLVMLEHIWKKRCDSHFKEAPSYKASAKRYLILNANMMLNIPKDVLRLKPSERKFYEETKHLLDGEKSEEEVYNVLIKFHEEHLKLTDKIKVFFVTVSGQVGRSGPVFLPLGSTIHDAVMKAVPNTFAALNRVELLRNGKVYKYNVKLKSHQKLRIYPGDQINIPQQMMFGNGGGKPGERIPFKKYREKGDPKIPTVKSKRAKLVWDKSKEYLKKLNKKELTDKDKWVTFYLEFRGVYGWRADFYEDLICLLEEEKRNDLAIFVALDLAELEPGSAEVLRRAARSLHRLGELDLALILYQRLLVLSPDSDVSYYDIARLYESQGKFAMAANHFWEACALIPEKNAEGRCIVYLEDLNGCIQKAGLGAGEIHVPRTLIRNVKMDTRVVLRWDAEQCNGDLLVEQPMLGMGAGFIYPVESVNKWKWSRNVSRGMGPESCSVRHIDPGEYLIKAKFKGDWVHESKSTATMTVEVIRHFGTLDETRETVTRRVPEGKTIEMMTLEQAPRPPILNN